jgi:hypothetical protein
MHKSTSLSVATTLLVGLANAQVNFSEILINGPGADQGQESVEIRGPANLPLINYYLLSIEGDGTGAGVVDQAISLGALAIGSNGLLLIRDTNAVIQPPPDAATNIAVIDFSPDLENGTNTWVRGFGTAPSVNTDLDTDDDGNLDSGIPGFTVVDAVSGSDGGASDRQYANQLGGYDVPNNGDTFGIDAYYRINDESGRPWCWTSAHVTAAGPTGPHTFDFASNDYQGGLSSGYGPQGLNLGSHNERLSLCTDVYAIGIAAGGTQKLTVDAGSANAGRLCLFVGSLSGTMPGIQITPTVHLPLNLDSYMTALLGAPNSLINPSVGVLDANGRMQSAFTLPPNAPIQTSWVFHHAAVVIDLGTASITFATTPATVFVQP